MQKLLSIPENLVHSFHKVTGRQPGEWFATSDPPGTKVGSGGGSAWLLAQHKQQYGESQAFGDYLQSGKRIIIHAGGQSRRLPAYAPSGKLLAPVPVFRWSRGQRLDQTLLDLQLPLLEQIMEATGPRQHVMIAAGDVLIQSPEVPFSIPDADVVCFGIWVEPHLASHHGVFFTPRNNPHQLDFMLQKPDHETIEKLAASHLYMMDVGIWVLSDRAVDLLMKKCGWNGADFSKQIPEYYDLYSAFGPSLGGRPAGGDAEIGALTAAVVPMNKGSFYHYGTSAELISSTEKIQNKVQDQRNIWHYRVKPHPSLFTMNAVTDIRWNQQHQQIWIENSHIPASWTLHGRHVLTGIPDNQWALELPEGLCLDVVPMGESAFCLRPYGMDDPFTGSLTDEHTCWMGMPVMKWFRKRKISLSDAGFPGKTDIQEAQLFPVLPNLDVAEDILRWMIAEDEGPVKSVIWLSLPRLSAAEISARANLVRLFAQREAFRYASLAKLTRNYKRSVFYQIDLKRAAVDFTRAGIPLPDQLGEGEPATLRFTDHMFRSEVLKLKGMDGAAEEVNAFGVLRGAISSSVTGKVMPRLNVFTDQIVWGRSPARLDLAGGWSDTPPYCMQNGGSVLNVAVELNSQPPIQVFIRLCNEPSITLRSIDNGVAEKISSYDELKDFNRVGSVFSIPKAALYLAGFHPDFCAGQYQKLSDQLADFGGGIEISLLAAIPKGSGLGTSSILAATVLGSLSDFCSLSWDHQVICHRTLILEQLLTTGGGWQDQYGGILPGVKLLESEPGLQDRIGIRWMPDHLFTQLDFRDCWLLYYTGITRVAKNILAEIVRGMFLNEGRRLTILNEIRQHAYNMAEAFQRSDYALAAQMIGRSWKLNNALDSGTNTPEIQQIIDQIDDYSIGYKLLGAGGGGFLVIASKDAGAAARIQATLNQHPPNNRARFVRMEVSRQGFQVTRS